MSDTDTQRPDERIAITSRVWQRTCDALAEAERENVELRRRLRLWGDLHHEQGWVDAEAVEEAYRALTAATDEERATLPPPRE